MKSRLFAILCLGVAIAACKKDNAVVAPASQKSLSTRHTANRFNDTTDSFTTLFISQDVANSMINSYLYSIDYTENDSDVKSFSVNADSLRAYLANTSIKNVKLMFAHTAGYIHSGHSGQYAGYQSGALTIIIAGYDVSGNYIYYNGKVLDHIAPCPYTCPIGAAGNDLLE